MDLHESVARLAGLQKRRRELSTQLSAGATRLDPYLRARASTTIEGLSYTLGRTGPIEEQTDRVVEEAMSKWARQLPVSQQQVMLHEERALRGPQAAAAAAPMAESGDAGSGDRRANYRPPPELGTPGAGGGDGSPGKGKARAVVPVTQPSVAFLMRMVVTVLVLSSWTGVHCWRGWRLWHAVDWDEEVLKRI